MSAPIPTPPVVLLDAAEFAVVAGPRAPVARHAGQPRGRWRQWRTSRRDSDTGPAVVQAATLWQCWRPSHRPSPLSQPQPAAAHRFRPFAAVVVGRGGVRYVRLSHGSTGHVPGGIQDSAERADQDAADLRYAPSLQRFAGVIDVRPGRDRPSPSSLPPGRPGPGAVVASASATVGEHGGDVVVVVSGIDQDHAQIYTQEQEPGHVRLRNRRRSPAQKLSPTEPGARRRLSQLTHLFSAIVSLVSIQYH